MTRNSNISTQCSTFSKGTLPESFKEAPNMETDTVKQDLSCSVPDKGSAGGICLEGSAAGATSSSVMLSSASSRVGAKLGLAKAWVEDSSLRLHSTR